MDINILLLLQEFRNGAGAFLADFLNKMTFLGELNTVMLVMAVIYWCVSKEFGTYLLMGWSGNRLVNGVLKVTVCAYRPWIRDARIIPYGDSIKTATVAAYAALKPYPADFDAEGKLLVDGAKMANDTFKSVGWCEAFLIGWILERRFVRFTTEVPVTTKLIRLVLGVLGFYLISLILVPLIKEWIAGAGGSVVSCFVQLFYVTFLFPLLAKILKN
ncbi:MAG: hypothetical protein K5779_08735 [Saccharofermentans sp.]|nr:hypothetical protein [Saccharofermentans sp.]